MTKVNGQMVPCHTPIQNPATPPPLGGVFSIGLGPATQLAAPRTTKSGKPMSSSEAAFFLDMPPKLLRAPARGDQILDGVPRLDSGNNPQSGETWPMSRAAQRRLLGSLLVLAGLALIYRPIFSGRVIAGRDVYRLFIPDAHF